MSLVNDVLHVHVQAKEAHGVAVESRSTSQSACDAVAADLQRVAQEQSDRLKQAQQSAAMQIAEEVQRLEQLAAKQQSERAAAHADESLSYCLSLSHACLPTEIQFTRAFGSTKAAGDPFFVESAVCAPTGLERPRACPTRYSVCLTHRRLQQCSAACETNKQVVHFSYFSVGPDSYLVRMNAISHELVLLDVCKSCKHVGRLLRT